LGEVIPITLDFESFWSTDFSLSKISFIEYINDPRFETISVSIKVGSGVTNTYFGDEVGPALKAIDWSDAAAIGHNGNEFDFPLLVWKYDCHPKMFVDTLCLARAPRQSHGSMSLDNLIKAYGLRPKDKAVLNATKGKRLVDFTPAEIERMRAYNASDVDNTYDLFKLFAEVDTSNIEDMRDTVKAVQWHKRELLLSDMTARMICYPQLQCDTGLLTKTAQEVQKLKYRQLQELTARLGVLDEEEVRATLASAPKFAAVLEAFGVEVPMKTSPTTGKQTYALAKTDPGFTALLDHDDPWVQSLAAARLGVKSTLLETRLARMGVCATVMNGWMPVPLAYHSATTGRWGGRVWNPQNLPRIRRNKDGNVIPQLTDALRNSLVAPPGHKVVVSDLSGIELRVNHWLWEVASTAALYDKDPQADLYKTFAARLYNILESAVTKDQRQLAKVAQLGLGFGAGAATFQRVAKQMGGITLTLEEAQDVVDKWRATYHSIVAGWYVCGQALHGLRRGAAFGFGNGTCMSLLPDHQILLPSGRKLYYPDLRREVVPGRQTRPGNSEFIYGQGRGQSFINGPRLCENLVQAIARDVIAEHALIIKQKYGHIPALTVHDELVYVVPEDEADEFLVKVNAVMRTPPTWLPGIVLWSEGDIAYSYGAAK
jgi:DNA polymerase I-like protein with 3'-5' exonuclease and polymerase domains